MDAFTVERVSGRVWRIIEDDMYKQYPIVYVVACPSGRLLLVDTATGTHDLRSYLQTLVTAGTFGPEIRSLGEPIVVLTHVHFDHCGGCYQFRDVWAGGAARAFSENYGITSLAAGVGATVRPFAVTRWLRAGDTVDLGCDQGGTKLELEVVETPGHTPDSISLLARWDNRIFVGDLLYPYTAIHVDVLGSNAAQYAATVASLLALARKEGGKSRKVAEFMESLGIATCTASQMSQAAALIAACDWNVREAVDVFLMSGGVLASSPSDPQFPVPRGLLLSCGHVEANLGAENSLSTISRLMTAVTSGTAVPSSTEEDSREYRSGDFSVFVPH